MLLCSDVIETDSVGGLVTEIPTKLLERRVRCNDQTMDTYMV